MVEFNFSNKFAYTFILLGILAIIAVGVNAYGTNNPPVMGHSVGELNLTPITIDQTNNRVGINKVSPIYTLDVNGGFNAFSVRSAGEIRGISLRIDGLVGPCTALETLIGGQVICGQDDVGSGGLTAPGATANYLSKFTGATSLGNSQIYDSGTNVGIGTSSPNRKLEVAGDIEMSGGVFYWGTDANGWSYMFNNPGIQLSSVNGNTDFWRGGGIGYDGVTVGSLTTMVGTGTSPYDTGEIKVGGVIRPTVAGGDVIIQLG